MYLIILWTRQGARHGGRSGEGADFPEFSVAFLCGTVGLGLTANPLRMCIIVCLLFAMRGKEEKTVGPGVLRASYTEIVT